MSGILEQISPDLVLVDPELAEAERARLRLREGVAASPPGRSVGSAVGRESGVVPRPGIVPSLEHRAQARETQAREKRVDEQRAPSVAKVGSRRRVRNAVLTASLMASAILISVVVAGSRENQSTSAFPAALRAITSLSLPQPARPTARSSKDRGTSPHASGTTRSSSAAKRNGETTHVHAAPKTAGAVERVILTTVVQSPAGKLPPALINPTTGLARNNLQAVCDRSTGESFSCVIRPLRHRPTEGLYVHYRPVSHRRGTLTWYPYRRG